MKKFFNETLFGFSVGAVFGLGMFTLVVSSIYIDWGTTLLEQVGTFYIGAEATWKGAIVALVWGFIEGFIGGYLIAWIYNKLHKA